MITVKKIAQLTGHNAAIFCLSEGKNKRYFLSGAGDGWVAEWDFDNPDPGRLVAKVDTQVFSLCQLKGQNKFVVGNMNGGVHWIDPDNPAVTKNIAHHKKGVYNIRQTGEKVLTLGGEGLLTRWDATECRSLESYHLSNQALRCLDYCEAKNELAVGASDNNIYLLDASTLELKQTIEGAHSNSIFTVRYSPDSTYLLSGGRDAHLNVWDTGQGFKKIDALPAHLFTVNDIAFHPKGHLFATASRDKTIKIWESRNFRLLKVLEGARDGGHFNSVNKLLWSEHNAWLVSCSDDRSLIIWDIG
jgi:hypothetical protein